MNKQLYILLLILTLCGCEVISSDEQLITLEQETGESGALLIDFTGINCANCPLAAAEAQQLTDIYSEQLITVEMHPASNPFTKASEQYDYTTDAADTYYKYFGGTAQTPFPTGVINFSQIDNAYFLDYTLWGTELIKRMQQEQKAKISSVAIEENSDNNSIHISDIQIESRNSDVRVAVWLVEDSLIGAQTMPDGTVNLNYAHNHVLRTVLTNEWGENLPIDITYTIPSDYSANHLNLVFVAFDENKQFLTATKQKLTFAASDEDEDGEDIEEDGKLLITIDGVGTVNATDTIIEITDFEQSLITKKDIMSVTGMLAYEGNLEVLIEREDENSEDQFCCAERCINTNYAQEQHLTFSVNGLTPWYIHYTPDAAGDNKVIYTFNPQKTSRKQITIIYKYNP